MLRCLAVSTSGTQISSDCPFKHLYHKSEEGSCQGGIPSTLRMFVANESVLSLDFQKLEGIRQAYKNRETVFTDAVTFAFSKVVRMRSLPLRGT